MTGREARRAPGRPLSRRAVLALPLAWALGRLRAAAAQPETRRTGYRARVDLLWGTLRFDLRGTIDETVNQGSGRYELRADGQGSGIASQVESTGVLRDGRWTPLRTRSRFLVYGRESRLEVSHDPDRRSIEYHGRQETFLLRRLRVTDDVLSVPEGMHVDDVVSATLNYADERWAPQPDGTLLTHVVRRRRGPREGTDDVERAYHAEIVPFVLRVTVDPESGRPTALVDLTRFSSWARESEPARVVFGPDRRPALVTAALILGTSVRIEVGA